MSRLEATFARLDQEGRGGLSIYIPLGYPDIPRSLEFMSAAVAGGADWLEVGIPFSDPAADGPVIQKATQGALQAGFQVQEGLAALANWRSDHPDVGLVAMTYANIGFHMGWSRFATALAEAGIDALILPDAPLEESELVRKALKDAGVGWVPLVAPTTPGDRMARIGETATDFLYVVGATGITGQQGPGPLVEQTVARAKKAGLEVPLAVGFGIRSASDVRRIIEAGADAAIVGTAVVERVVDGATPQEVQAFVATLAEGTR